MITYKHEHFIKEAILGVLSQKVSFNVELIVADDNSPDNTEQEVSNIKSSHPKSKWLKYTRHKKNIGMMPNFIWALEQCKGRYIAICEGDDFWTDPYKLQKQVNFLEQNSEYCMCFHDANFLRNNIYTLFSSKYTFLKNKVDYSIKDVLKYKWFIPTASICFRNILSFKHEYTKINAGDYLIILLCATRGKIHYMPDIMSVYRIHEGGVSHNIKSKNDFYKKRLSDIKTFIKIIPLGYILFPLRWYLSISFRLFSSKYTSRIKESN